MASGSREAALEGVAEARLEGPVRRGEEVANLLSVHTSWIYDSLREARTRGRGFSR